MHLIAWIEHSGDLVAAAFVAAAAPDRQPARGLFAGPAAERLARQWVEAEASAIDARIEWRA